MSLSTHHGATSATKTHKPTEFETRVMDKFTEMVKNVLSDEAVMPSFGDVINHGNAFTAKQNLLSALPETMRGHSTHVPVERLLNALGRVGVTELSGRLRDDKFISAYNAAIDKSYSSGGEKNEAIESLARKMLAAMIEIAEENDIKGEKLYTPKYLQTGDPTTQPAPATAKMAPSAPAAKPAAPSAAAAPYVATTAISAARTVFPLSAAPEKPADTASSAGDTVGSNVVPFAKVAAPAAGNLAEPQPAKAQNSQGSEFDAFTALLESFGTHMRRLRDEAKLSRNRLAECLVEVMNAPVETIDATHVRKWEKDQVVPTQEQFEALEKVLIDRNPNLQPGEREQKREILRQKYAERIQMGDNFASKEGGFGDFIEDLRGDKISRDHMAMLITAEMKPANDTYTDMLKQYGQEYIAGVEANAVGLSRPMLKAMTKIFKDAKVSEEKIARLYELYKEVEEPRSHAERAASVAVPESVLAHRRKIHAYFTDSGNQQLSLAEIHRLSKINQLALGQIMGTGSGMNIMRRETLTERIDALSDLLKQLGKDENIILAFAEDMRALNRLVETHRNEQQVA